MHLNDLDRLLWAAGFFVHIALLVVLFTRRHASSFPLFTAFIGFNALRTVALFLIQCYGNKHVYFYTYWFLAPVDVVSQLLVIAETAAKVFRSEGKWAVDVSPGMAWWAIVSVFIAAVLTLIPQTVTTLWEQPIFIKGSFFSAALVSELFVGMIVLSARSGLSWKTYVGSILQGLGAYSFATVVIETARTYFGLQSNGAVYDDLSRIRRILYLLCAVYWVIMLRRKIPPPRVTTDRMRKDISALADIAKYSAREIQ
jgi:hypothetical protein